MTSKERSLLRSQANTIETTLIVGKGGVSDALIAEAEILLNSKELVKGRVLESALLSPQEAQSAICAATGAEGIQIVGSNFVIWRKSEQLEKEKKSKPASAVKTVKKSGKDNPVKAGIKARKRAAEQKKQQRDQYFHDLAVQSAIERRKQREAQD